MHVYFKKVIPLVFLFGFMISFFSMFNVISPGEDMLILFNIKSNFMGLNLPPYLSITREGLNIFLILTLRVLNSISMSVLFFEIVRFDDFIYSLKKIKISDFFLLILNISYIYIFNFSKLIEDFYNARKSRVLNTSISKERNWVINTAAYLLLKAINHNEKVFDAMISRGLGKKIVLRDRKFPVKQVDIYSLILLFVFMWMVINF